MCLLDDEEEDAITVFCNFRGSLRWNSLANLAELEFVVKNFLFKLLTLLPKNSIEKYSFCEALLVLLKRGLV